MANPVETIRPNATVLDDDWTPSTGTSHGVTSDDSDVTYTTPASSDLEYLRLGLGTSTLALASGSQVRSVKYRARIANSAAASNKRLRFAFMYGDELGDIVAFTPTSSIAEITGPKYSKAPDGQSWDQDRLDDLVLRIRSENSAANRVYEAYVDIEYNTAPTVAVSAVATDTATPTISWAYADGEGDPQERFRVKIFSAAQYGAGGFDPDISTATYDSGEIYSFATSHTITTGLVNGTTYRAYVKAADAGSSGRYSVWDYEPFTFSITPPPVPTVVATADSTNARVSLAITQGGPTPATTYFEVQRSEDAGTTWEFIRGGEEVTNAGGVAGNTVYDYEMHRGLAVQYRARAVQVSSGLLLISAYSSTSSATVAVIGTWIKCYDDPSKNLRVYLQTKRLEFESLQAKGIHRALGRSTYQARSGQIYDLTAVLPLWLENTTKYNSFKVLRTQAKVLLQLPYGETGSAAEQYWVSFGELLSIVVVSTASMSVAQRRDITIPIVTVEAP